MVAVSLIAIIEIAMLIGCLIFILLNAWFTRNLYMVNLRLYCINEALEMRGKEQLEEESVPSVLPK